MAEKRLNARVSEEEFLTVKQGAETVGMTVAEFTRMAALNIGKQSATGEATASAMAVILDRIDDLEARLSDPSSTPQDGPGLTDIGEAIGDLYAAQKRTDETLQNVVQTLGKIFDHLARSATQSAVPVTTRPAPAADDLARRNAAILASQQAAQPTPQAPAFRRCTPGTVYDEFRLTDEQPRPQREDFYRRHLRRIVESNGWDSKVTAEQYGWVGLTPPAGLYDL